MPFNASLAYVGGRFTTTGGMKRANSVIQLLVVITARKCTLPSATRR